MKKIAIITTLLIITLNFNAKAQTIGSFPSDSTLNKQIDWLFKKSYSYQDNKVISKEKFVLLQNNINDTVSHLKNELAGEKKIIKNQKESIKALENNIENLNVNIETLNKEKDGIYFLGSLITKKAYNTYLWSIISVLSIALLFIIFKFKNSNSITSKTKKELGTLQSEFETFRKKALEKEQVIMRKLQDELNKKN